MEEETREEAREEHKGEGLYIQVFSIHGLVRYENLELGRDADTGGQVKYVVEYAEALSSHPRVAHVDLFTRLVSDKRVSPDYSRQIEQITDNYRIVRIQCGGRKYMRKELLWPHLDEYIDKTIQFIKKEGRYPDVVHGHYPDAGYVCMHLSEFFGTPFIFTGHSLGRPKKQKLMADGMTQEEVDRVYKIEHRIKVEEDIIKNADLIVTSTSQEVEKQYGMYTNQDLADYAVVPPGINLNKFYPYYHDHHPEAKKDENSLMAWSSVNEELERFLVNPDKPLILALCRPDKKKNISGLVNAYGRDKELQAMANLAIFAGIRKNIQQMEDNEQDVLTRMLLLMDKYDLYGKMAIPKSHDFTYEVPELYRITAEKKGVFVNVAFTEPFGLTLIEASACGLPIVATNDGGPKDIMDNCQNGFLVSPTELEEVSSSIRRIIADADMWKRFSNSGAKCVQEHYSWSAHVESFLERLDKAKGKDKAPLFKKAASNPVGDRLISLNHFVISDIDNTLTGDGDSLNRFMEMLKENRERVGFGLATGRTLDSALEVCETNDILPVDVIIASVGTEIHYKDGTVPDKGWRTHISKRWNRKRIKEVLDRLDFLEYQEDEKQRDFKVSYYMTDGGERIPEIHDALVKAKCHYNLVYSDNEYLDILPIRASKGKALRYLSYKWGLPLDGIVVCGDSGNDIGMLIGSTLGIIVGNHSTEMEQLRGKRRVYFAQASNSEGVLEGLEYYRFWERARE
ncbi:MAG: HAD-IIB family hydrolase [Desulfatibacillaceae bacterium]